MPRGPLNLSNCDSRTTPVALPFVGALVAESTSSVTDGVGAFVFDELTAGTYRLAIGSDINGDNSWGGPGEMSGSSDLFQITDTNVTVDINLAPEKTGVANSAPVITSNPTTVAFVGSTYIYGVQASDADDDDLVLRIEIIGRGPKGFQYDLQLVNCNNV